MAWGLQVREGAQILGGSSAVINHCTGMVTSTLLADHFIAAIASVRVIRTAGGTPAVYARERSGATLLSILTGRIVAEGHGGFAGQIDRHEQNNSAPGLIRIASRAIGSRASWHRLRTHIAAEPRGQRFVEKHNFGSWLLAIVPKFPTLVLCRRI